MICANCGFEVADDASFCTNCGTALSATSAADDVPDIFQKTQPSTAELGASLEAAVQANKETIDSIEARAQAQVDAAFSDFPPADGSIPQEGSADVVSDEQAATPATGAAAGAAAAGAAAADTAAGAAAAGAAAAGAAAADTAAGVAAGVASAVAGAATQANQGGQFSQATQPEPPFGFGPNQAGQPQAQPGAFGSNAPFYQQGVSPNAHYSSQRSYDGNAYGQNTHQPNAGYQQPFYNQQGPQQYQQPPYGQPAGASAQPAWVPTTTTTRAFAMVLYIAGLIGLIIALCVRDRNDPFITHHLNNVVVILIGTIIGVMLSVVLIGVFINIYLLVMTIMGMVSAYNGNMDELPLIGKIHIIK